MTNTELPRRSKSNRYFVDKRVGCIAISDLLNKQGYLKVEITPQERADEIIQLMTDWELTPDEMLIVIEKVRQKLNLIELTKMGGENESDIS